MTAKERRWTIILGAIAIAALIVLAAGLSGLYLQPSKPTSPLAAPQSRPTEGPDAAASPAQEAPVVPPAAGSDLLFYILAVLTIASVVAAVTSRRGRRLAVVMLLGLLLYLLLPTVTGDVAPPASPPSTPTDRPAAQAPLPSRPPQWLSLAISFGLAILLLGAGLLIVQRLAQRPAAVLQVESPPAEPAAEGQVTPEEIRAGSDLLDAVTRCYAEMSRIARERHDIRRAVAMTAHEFAEQLKRAGLPQQEVWRITRLFERVRYGNRPPGPAEEIEARACLQAVVRAMTTLPAQAHPAKE